MKPALRRTQSSRPRQSFLLIGLLSLTAVLSWTGCRVVSTTAEVPGRTVKVFFPGGKSAQPDPGDLQESLMRFADSYTAVTIEVVDQLTDVPGSPFNKETALRFKITTAGGFITMASGDNPYADLLDMVSVTTLTRMVLENHWVTETNGALFEPWLKSVQKLQTNIWSIADQVLGKPQQEELRNSIQQRYASMTDLDGLFLVHPQDLLVPRTLAKKKDAQSVFNLTYLDPLSGLDPAVREITETRLFAARALYTIQRMPWLVRWQSELLLLDSMNQPKVTQALNDATSLSESVDRASKAAETISQTATNLPGQITEERKAIVEALNAQEGQINTMLQSGTEFSTSLNTTIGTFDALMKRFGVGEPDTNPPPAGDEGPPFNILDYAKTADQITAMAKELNIVINDLNNSLDSPALDRLSKQTANDARSLLNHIFLLAAGLVLLVLVCALIYRYLGGRRGRV